MRAQNGHTRSADGTRIHFQTLGEGPTIFCVNGLAVPLHYWQSLCAHFADRYHVVCWEYRGHGDSDRPHDPRQFAYEDIIDDGLAVLEHLDIERAIGIGHSSGFQVLLDLYASAPQRFSALSSFVGTYGNTLSHFFGSSLSRLVFDMLYCLTVFYPKQVGLFSQLFNRSPLPHRLGDLLGIINAKHISKAQLQPYLNSVMSLDPHFFATVAQAAENHTAESVLETIKIPTLLIAAQNDKFVPLPIATHMHESIPESELHVIPDATHGALFETPELFNQRLAQFLWQHRLAPETATSPRTHQPPRSAQS